MRHRVLLAVAFAFLASDALAQDFTINLTNDGASDYRVTAVSSALVFNGSLPSDDPTLSLIQGKRYRITNAGFGGHPFAIAALGTTDTVLLSQSGTGSLEGDAGIAWSEQAGGVVEFTVTPSLVAAFTAGGRSPGYRCRNHPLSMRGAFALFGTGTPIDNPIPAGIPASPLQLVAEPVATGFVSPVLAVAPPDGSGRLFVVDQPGQLRVIDSAGALLETPALDVAPRMMALGIPDFLNYDERGFLGFAFHPQFATNGKVYTYTSEPASGTPDFAAPALDGNAADHHAVVAEWTMAGNTVDPGSRRELLRVEEPQFNHNGGAIHFGPDGLLYIALGDGGGADDQSFEGTVVGHGADGNGQNPQTVLGAILRIDPAGSNSANGQYGIPATNPFAASGTNAREIYCYGLRNPYNFSFDMQTGALWIGDVGQNKIEELNAGALGANYGWRLKEGSFFFDANGTNDGFVTNVATQPVLAALTEPVAQYDHDEGSAIIAGFVERSGAIPELEGKLLFADFGTFAGPSGRVFVLDAGNTIRELFFGGQPLNKWIKGMGQDAAGNVYICASDRIGIEDATGTVLRIGAFVPESTDVWVLY